MVKKSPPPKIEQFNACIKNVEVLLSITRENYLQEQACSDLDLELSELSSEKQLAILGQDEDYANLLLGCECVNRALHSELRMWLLLKSSEPEAAWDQLINAQEAAAAAARAHRGFSHLSQHVAKLEAIERLVFPPQVFISSGMVALVQKCSICEKNYGDCMHLAGMPYMGEFCYVKMEHFTFDHASIVENPADKRCRITSFNVSGGMRNRMTWAIAPETNV